MLAILDLVEEAVAAGFEFGDGVGGGWVDEVAGGVEVGFLESRLFFGEQGEQLLGDGNGLAQGVIEGITGGGFGLQFGDAGFEFFDAGEAGIALGGERGGLLLLRGECCGLFLLKALGFQTLLLGEALAFSFFFGFGLLLRNFGLALEFLLALTIGFGDPSRPRCGFRGALLLQSLCFGAGGGGGLRLFFGRRLGC